MKKSLLVLIAFLFFDSISYAQVFPRVGIVPLSALEESGYGNIVAEVDLDNDGRKEIYAVNNNWNDGVNELIPKIWKFEFNGTTWDSVWGAIITDIPKQNTWPALTYGDLDKDNKMEIIWGPINYLDATNTNPARILVFEAKGDGSDKMGIQNGANSLPNAKWTITATPSTEIRPFRWFVADIDADNKNELIFADRQTITAASYKWGVISVSSIPDNGGGTETWTLEYSGTGITTLSTSVIYDLFILDNVVYIVHNNGAVTPFKYSSGAWSLGTYQAGVVPGGSWKSASVVDIDNNGTKEVVTGGFNAGNNKAFLIRKAGDTLVSSPIANFAPLTGAARVYGGDAGDIELDGKLDFVFGSRDAVPNGSIVRVKYLGGSITDSNNYASQIIDKEFMTTGGRFDIIDIANVDNDAANEVIYSNGINGSVPLVVLDYAGLLPVELKTFNVSIGNNGVTLSWSTATEVNNHGFEIQRKSTDGNFITVAFVKGNGTSTVANTYQYIDAGIADGKYSYRLKQIDLNGQFSYSEIVNVNLNIPSDFVLEQNYPNPFNPSTMIKFSLPEKSNVTLKIYDIMGKEVVSLISNELKEAGSYQIQFNAVNLSSGTYLYRLEAGGKSLVSKMIFMK